MAKVIGSSLFAKTGLLAFCLFGGISLLSSGIAAWALFERMTSEYISKGSAIATSIAGVSEEIMLVRDAATIQSVIDKYLTIEGIAYVFVKDHDGRVIAHTFVPKMPEVLDELENHKNHQVVTEMKVDKLGRVIDISSPILTGVVGYVHVGMDRELIMEYFWEVILKMQAMLLAAFWVCVGILYYVTRRISRPLDQLTEYARKLSAHDFNATIDISTGDELEVLGRSMESMGHELSTLFDELGDEVGKATRDLKEHMAYLSAIIDNLADGLLVTGVGGEISLVNPAMRDLFDLGSGRLRGMPMEGTFPEELVMMAREVRKCDDNNRTAEVPLSRGRTGNVIGSCIRVSEGGGMCLGAILLVRDITREKKLDQLKTDFITTVSHELRTPMTSVLGFAKIIRKKLDKSIFPYLKEEKPLRSAEQVGSNMNIIVSEAERLTELINDVLDIARIEAGEVRWRDTSVDMTEVIKHSRQATKGLWQAKGLQVDTVFEDDLPAVLGDYDRLVQVVVNLLSNSIKFSNESPIICCVVREGPEIKVSVADRGDGIGEEDVQLVFEKFKQAGDTLTDKPSGTGLGLPICRQIVERHGGHIWVHSEKGAGSTFFFTIPVHQEPATVNLLPQYDSPEVLKEPESRRPRLLVVNDDPALIRYISELFSEESYRVRVAADSSAAVLVAEGFDPDVVLMDNLLLEQGGLEVLNVLSEADGGMLVPVLLVSLFTLRENGFGNAAGSEERVLGTVASLVEGRPTNNPCLVLGEESDFDTNGSRGLCRGIVRFGSWEQAKTRGFDGTILIPMEERERVPLDEIIETMGLAVILPNRKTTGS